MNTPTTTSQCLLLLQREAEMKAGQSLSSLMKTVSAMYCYFVKIATAKTTRFNTALCLLIFVSKMSLFSSFIII